MSVRSVAERTYQQQCDQSTVVSDSMSTDVSISTIAAVSAPALASWRESRSYR